MHPPNAAKPPHCFALRDLIQDALTIDKVHCPKHNGYVDIEILVSLWKKKAFTSPGSQIFLTIAQKMKRSLGMWPAWKQFLTSPYYY
jgi:hypothetical protein